MATVAPSHSNLTFTPSDVASANAQQKLAIWIPTGTAPNNGWPVIISNEGSGYTNASPLSTLDSTANFILYQSLQNGIAVISHGLSGVNVAHTGGGLFHPPGTYRYRAFDRPNAWKDTAWAVQWARKNAATYDFDTARLALLGFSSGAAGGLWCALGPERVSTGKVSDSQNGESTRVKMVIAPNAATWWPGFVTTLNPGFYPNTSDLDTAATSLALALPPYRVAASPHYFAFNSSAPSHDDTYILLAADTANTSSDYGTESYVDDDWRFGGNLNTGTDVPTLFNSETATHSSWMAYSLMYRLRNIIPTHPERRRLYVASGVAQSTIENGTFSGTVSGSGLADLVVPWIGSYL